MAFGTRGADTSKFASDYPNCLRALEAFPGSHFDFRSLTSRQLAYHSRMLGWYLALVRADPDHPAHAYALRMRFRRAKFYDRDSNEWVMRVTSKQSSLAALSEGIDIRVLRG